MRSSRVVSATELQLRAGQSMSSRLFVDFARQMETALRRPVTPADLLGLLRTEALRRVFCARR